MDQSLTELKHNLATKLKAMIEDQNDTTEKLAECESRIGEMGTRHVAAQSSGSSTRAGSDDEEQKRERDRVAMQVGFLHSFNHVK